MSYTYDITMFKETFESEFTWLNGFMRNVRRFGYRTAVIDPASDKEWTYEELNADANRLANAFKKSGLKKSDLSFMQLYNCPEFLFNYIACQKIGAIANPANFNLSPGETAEVISHNKPKVYLYDAEIAKTAVKALKLSAHKPEFVIAVNRTVKDFALPEGHILYEDYVKDASAENPPVDFEPHIYDEVLRLQTSGTTGTPKGVPLNNINEVLSAHDVIMHFPINPTDITMNMTPWFHRGGIHSGGPTPTLYAGAGLVIMRTFNPKWTLRYIERYKITFITGVPSVLTLLASRQEKRHKDISSLKGIITMGLPEMSGTAGRSCTDDEVRIVKVFEDRKAEPDELVATDNSEEGEVIIKCPQKSTYCYVDNPQATEEKFYKGWMYTGDIGTWDKRRFITIAGRKDDMIISKGENIYPARIEEVLNSHPKVAECIVTGVPDSTRGESVAAYVIPEDDSLTVQELIDYCNESPNISKYQAPRYYRFVKDVPRTATGKKQHFVIKKQAKEDLKKGLLLKK